MAAKYLRMVGIEFKHLLEYKVGFLLSLIRIPVQVGMLLIVWLTLFRVGGITELAGLDISSFVMYIILARLIMYCQKPWDVYEMLFDYIRTGKLGLYLARPINFGLYFFSRILGSSLVSFCIIITLLLLGNFLPIFGIPYFFPDPVHFLLFIASFLLALVLGFLLYFCISLTMFWVYDIWSIWGIIEGIQGFFSGEYIPLTVVPWYYTLPLFLPFKHLVFTPVFIYLEKYSLSQAIGQIGLQVVWIIVFILIVHVIMKRGLQKIDVQGG